MTPEQIESVLADFRDWLRDHAEHAPDAEPLPEPVDLHALVAQFIALRQEVNLQTRAVRQQQEQNSETLQRYSESIELLDSALKQVENQSEDTERLRPLLGALIDVADTQQLAAREMARLAQSLKALADTKDELAPEPPGPTLLGRLLGIGRIARQQQQWLAELAERSDRRSLLRALEGAPADQVRAMVESAASGLAMGLQRIERTMRKHGLDPIPTLGRPFDPEEMEAVAVVADTNWPAGEVIEEVRRGYRFNDRVFRFAQVRVAK